MRVLVPTPDKQRVERQSEPAITTSSSVIQGQMAEVAGPVPDDSSNSYMATSGDDADMDDINLGTSRQGDHISNTRDSLGSVSQSGGAKDKLGTIQQRRHYHTHSTTPQSRSQPQHQFGTTTPQSQKTSVHNVLATTSVHDDDSSRNHIDSQRQNRQRTHSPQPTRQGSRTQQPHESRSQLRPQERNWQPPHSHQNRERQQHEGQSQSSTSTQGSDARHNRKRKRHFGRREGDKRDG